MHYLHSDYSLALEKLTISYGTLSNYCKEIAGKYGIKVGDIKELLQHLGNITNYLVYHKNIQLYLSPGLKLTTIH